MADDELFLVTITWQATPFRGDKFRDAWLPACEAVLRYGATGWALYRSKEGGAEFTQLAFFRSKLDWERYWYSEEIAERRAKAAGLFQVPVLPAYHEVVGQGALDQEPAGT